MSTISSTQPKPVPPTSTPLPTKKVKEFETTKRLVVISRQGNHYYFNADAYEEAYRTLVKHGETLLSAEVEVFDIPKENWVYNEKESLIAHNTIKDMFAIE